MIGCSKAMSKAVTDIVDNSESAMVLVKLIFNTPKQGKILEVDRLIDEIKIEQDFITTFHDTFMVYFRVEPNDYLMLYENYKDLECTVEMRQVLNDTNLKQQKVVFNQKYKVIINNREDIFKSASASALFNTEDTGDIEQYYSTLITVEMQLIEPIIYTFRKHNFNCLLKNVKMEDIIYLIADTLKVKKLYLVPPDNDKQYEYFKIPPFHQASTIFQYLQNSEDGGIYNKGVSYYYTQGVLYVFPKFETDIKNTPYVTHIYRIPQDTFMGLDSFYRKLKNDYYVLANLGSYSAKLAEKGVEDVGTSFIVKQNDLVVDKCREVTENKVIINEDNVTNLILSTDTGMITNSFTARYKESNGNMFKLKTELSSYNRELHILSLAHIPIFMFSPGYKVTFNYDKNKVFKTVSGVCERVEYTISFTNKANVMYGICSCTCQLSTTITKDNK